ncbi:hypothetical protein BCY86_05760 [Pajaroellobacter abortibovis]|uniref:Uncharacterized protein n=1 Tax=Pajaroellobacter abortibovis TaxID=1882918 RepID=A0A1L6MXE5_9BACT|nr:hypothetical protein BCY86_05760 [Pajaroellobacter abortibovis]
MLASSEKCSSILSGFFFCSPPFWIYKPVTCSSHEKGDYLEEALFGFTMADAFEDILRKETAENR